MSERDPGLPWAVSDLVCDHGHVEAAAQFEYYSSECWYGHPVVGADPERVEP